MRRLTRGCHAHAYTHTIGTGACAPTSPFARLLMSGAGEQRWHVIEAVLTARGAAAAMHGAPCRALQRSSWQVMRAGCQERQLGDLSGSSCGTESTHRHASSPSPHAQCYLLGDPVLGLSHENYIPQLAFVGFGRNARMNTAGCALSHLTGSGFALHWIRASPNVSLKASPAPDWDASTGPATGVLPQSAVYVCMNAWPCPQGH